MVRTKKIDRWGTNNAKMKADLSRWEADFGRRRMTEKTQINKHFMDILQQQLEHLHLISEAVFMYTPRQFNQVADRMTQIEMRSDNSISWVDHAPYFISYVISFDLPD